MSKTQLRLYKSKAATLVDNLLASSNYDEKELVVLAAAMIISDFETDCTICDELDDVEKYLQKYHDTGDPEYLEFARHEMAHAKKPLSVLSARIHTATSDELDLYNALIERVKALETKLL